MCTKCGGGERRRRAETGKLRRKNARVLLRLAEENGRADTHWGVTSLFGGRDPDRVEKTKPVHTRMWTGC